MTLVEGIIAAGPAPGAGVVDVIVPGFDGDQLFTDCRYLVVDGQDPAAGAPCLIDAEASEARVVAWQDLTDSAADHGPRLAAVEGKVAVLSEAPLNAQNPPTGITAAAADNVTDDWATFKALHDLCGAGGRIYIPTGRYFLGQPWNWDNTLHVEGDGTSTSTGWAATQLRFPIGVDGIVVDNFTDPAGSQLARLAHLTLRSDAAIAGAGRGLVVRGHGMLAEHLQIQGFASHGVDVDTTLAGTNANRANLHHIRSRLNKGDGFHIDGDDSNAIVLDFCDASGNLGWGIWNDGNGNAFEMAHLENNEAGAAIDTGNSSLWLWPYIEGPFAGSPPLAQNMDLSGCTNSLVLLQNFGTPTLTPAPASTTRIWRNGHYDKFLRLGNNIDAGAQAIWQLSSGSYATGSLALANQSDLVNIFNVNKAAAAATRLQMLVGLAFASKAAADVPNGSLFVDSADSKLKFKDNAGVVNALY